MTKVNKIIGIDIAKEKFDVCFSFQECEYSHRGYVYDTKSINCFMKEVSQDCLCIMEATGIYHLKLAYALHERGIMVSVVNPLSVKNFSRAIMCRTKTDKVDSRILVDYARKMDVEIWAPTSDTYIRIQQIYRTIELFQRNITQTINQLEAIELSPIQDKMLSKMLHNHIKQLEYKIAQLENQIELLIEKVDSEVINNICTIPGVGKKTAIGLLTATKGLHGFVDYRQLSSYLGLCPRIYDSGKSVHGKAHICKMGMGWIRKLLYLCALSARRCNKSCAAQYERLREQGKAAKVALIAVANKLLRQIFAIVKNNCAYDKNYA